MFSVNECLLTSRLPFGRSFGDWATASSLKTAESGQQGLKNSVVAPAGSMYAISDTIKNVELNRKRMHVQLNIVDGFQVCRRMKHKCGDGGMKD